MYLFLFTPDLIFRISFKPSAVKWVLFLINSAARQKSLKSKFLTPWRGYSLNKGIILSVISEILDTTNEIALALFLYVLPQLSFLAILLINSVSRIFWQIEKDKLTAYPNLDFLDVNMFIEKQHYPSTNPTSQFRSISVYLIEGLLKFNILGKALIKVGDSPKLREALILTILAIPCSDKCSLLLIISTINLKS